MLAARVPDRSIAEAQLDALFDASPTGLGFWDTDLRFVRVNEALARINGLPIEAHIGKRLDELLPELGAYFVEVLGDVLRTGVARVDVEERGVTPAEPGVEHDWLVSYYPVANAVGELIGVGAVVTDITERKQAERELAEANRRAASLAAASHVLGTSLDLQETLDHIAALLVPDLADWAFVELLHPDGTIDRAAVAHRDPGKRRWVRDLGARYPLDPDSPVGSPRVIRTGEPEWAAALPDEMLEAAAIDDEHLRLLRELGFRSYMIVPLRARGTVLGDLALVMAESGRAFAEDDLAFAQDVADRCALAVDNARLYSQRAELAHTLQTALLPPVMPQLPDWELATRYRAAGALNEVGGDFYDAVRFEGGWALVIGDVAGKGARAAALTALARHSLHAVLELTGRADEALWYLNERLIRRPELSLTSAAIAVLRDGADEIEVVIAGHPLPLLRHAGEVTAVGSPGPMLGAFERERGGWTGTVHEVGPGDSLLLYTDGVLDAVGHRDRFGEPRLREVLGRDHDSAAGVAAAVTHALDTFEAGLQVDDVALLALRRR
jgi:PAS domain S-box-containing protein